MSFNIRVQRGFPYGGSIDCPSKIPVALNPSIAHLQPASGENMPYFSIRNCMLPAAASVVTFEHYSPWIAELPLRESFAASRPFMAALDPWRPFANSCGLSKLCTAWTMAEAMASGSSDLRSRSPRDPVCSEHHHQSCIGRRSHTASGKVDHGRRCRRAHSTTRL